MNERFFKDSVTIYNQLEDDTYQRTIIDKVYCDRNKKTIINELGIQKASYGIIVIPIKIAKIKDCLAIKSYIDTRSLKKENAILNFTLNSRLIDHPWTLFDNDYIIDGKCTEDFDLRKLSKEYKLFRISTVNDNRKGGLPHFELELNQ